MIGESNPSKANRYRLSGRAEPPAKHGMPPVARCTDGQRKTSFDDAGSLENDEVYDVFVVGAGPAGRAVGACAALAGLKAIVVERKDRLEDAGSSPDWNALIDPAKEEPGMGPDRTARKCVPRVHLALATEVVGLASRPMLHTLETKSGTSISARTVVVATGADDRRLNVPGSRRFEDRGLHYAATGMEAALCVNEKIVVVGGGVSGVRAAVFLGGIARHVHLLVRGADLRADLSPYLVERLRRSSQIRVHFNSEVVELGGKGELANVTWRDTASNNQHIRRIRHLFVMIGTVPNTSWLSGLIDLDRNGFVCTGTSLSGAAQLGTNCPSLFAVGDVRSGSLKREDAAVGEGIAVVAEIQNYLNAMDRDDA